MLDRRRHPRSALTDALPGTLRLVEDVLVVRDYEENLSKFSGMLKELDVKQEQVLIDVATGARTAVDGLTVDATPCIVADADFAPDGAGLAVLTTATADGPVVVFHVDPASGSATPLTTLDGASLAEAGALGYSPDGSLLAVGAHDDAAPYAPRAVVLDRTGAVVREWPAALHGESVWYGNDALRASELEQTTDGEWKGWLIPSTGATIGEIRPYDESPWEYGPAPTPLGATHGQQIRPHLPTAAEAPDPASATPWAFDLEDTATGMVRSWLPILDSTAPADRQPTLTGAVTTLAQRTR